MEYLSFLCLFVCVLCVSCVCPVCVLCVSCVCPVCVLCVSCVCPVCVLCVSCVCPVCVQIGQFFGVIDPMLMLNLLNESLFSFNKTYDYQAVCFPTKENRSAAGLRSVYVVSSLTSFSKGGQYLKPCLSHHP
uniref:Voltage-dependent calcium channel alpha-2/delta subunit conserved region domain-containing protein n=1 Tax=Astyanax mexicanus TaxID=7994 RepID=A0A3B1K254_ASTMX